MVGLWSDSKFGFSDTESTDSDLLEFQQCLLGKDLESFGKAIYRKLEPFFLVLIYQVLSICKVRPDESGWKG